MNEEMTWVTRGFDGFSRGTMGNGGHNLYVSRSGVLQRIHQFDLNGDGYLDLVFCNDHNHGEQPHVFVYRDPLEALPRPTPEKEGIEENIAYDEDSTLSSHCPTDRRLLRGNSPVLIPADGAKAGAVADLNGDGYDDLVIGNFYNGLRYDLNAFVYYGGHDGFSERRHQILPAPLTVAVASGDFNGDGKPDLAFLCQRGPKSSDRYLRVFQQSELGFEQKRFTDFDIEAEQIDADDLDGDGYSDLVVRTKSGGVAVYWGGPDGVDLTRKSDVPQASTSTTVANSPQVIADQPGEDFEDAPPLPKVLSLGGVPHIFVPSESNASLVPVTVDRGFGPPLTFNCQMPMSVAVGNISGDGSQDLVFGCRENFGESQRSWVYWDSNGKYDETDRTSLDSFMACDVAVSDLDGDGTDEIVLCQMRTETSYDTESLVYHVRREGVSGKPVHLQTADPRRVFVPNAPAGEPKQVVFINYRSRNALGNVSSTVYWGSPDGFSEEKSQPIPGFRAVDAVYADVNDDGIVDLVICNSYANTSTRAAGSYVLLGGPDGLPERPSMTLPTDQAQGMVCADINRDGYLDLIFASIGSPNLVIYYGTKEGFDVANPQFIHMELDGEIYSDPRWIYLADLNNDGWLDLFVPQVDSDRSFVLWGGPLGYSMDRIQLLSVWHAACARAADLTGNGYLDLIVGGHQPSEEGPHDSFAHIYWNGPGGIREDNKSLLPGNAINSMAVADFNNDGRLDLFIGSYHDGKQRDIDSYIYWQREDGFSATDRTRMPTHSASGCIAADFDDDGWVDIAIAYHRIEGEHLAHSAVWWNSPEGFSEHHVTTLPTAGPHGISNVEPGSIIDRGPEEYYSSEPFKLPDGTVFKKVTYEAIVPPKTWLEVHLRFADSTNGLSQAAWITAAKATDQTGKWMQYRLTLGAEKGMSSPRVSEVSVSYGMLE